MGNKSSKLAGERQESRLQDMVVEFSCCRHVPHVDLLSPSDPYIKAYVMTPDSKGRFKKLGKCRRTLHKNDADHPVFTAFRKFTCKVDPQVDRLWIEVWDVDVVKNELIGRAVIKISDISDEPRWFDIARAARPSAPAAAPTGFQVKLRRVSAAERAPAQRKGFFIVRHGESKWNEAQRDRAVGDMMAFDHGLTAAGVAQATALNAHWKAAIEQLRAGTLDDAAADTPYIRKFSAVDKAFASPLTRAVQTALVVLRGHPTIEGLDAEAEAADAKHERPAAIGQVEAPADVDAAVVVAPASPAAATGAGAAANSDADGAGAETPSSGALGPPVGPLRALSLASVGEGDDDAAAVATTAELDGCDPDEDAAVLAAAARADDAAAAMAAAARAPEKAATAARVEADAGPRDLSDRTDFSLERAARLTLASRVREVKNIGGLDTVGKAIGDAVMPRVRAELADVVRPAGEDDEDAALLRWAQDVIVNVGDAASEWWTPGNTYESAAQVETRVQDWLDFVRYHEAETPIFVGHSLFYKAFYSKRMSAGFKAAKPELAAKLAKHKLGNAVLMYVEVDFSGEVPEIADAHILFGGGFHEH